MTAIQVTYLYCDGAKCPRSDGAEQEPFDTDPTTFLGLADQRAQAKKAGWIRLKGKDLCSLCAIDSGKVTNG